MTHPIRAQLLLAGAALLLVGGCAAPALQDSTESREAPVQAIRHEPLGRDFFLRQSVVATTPQDERRFEIVLQSRCEELRLIALTSFGLRLFSAVRNADGIEVDSLAGQSLPFDPARVLRDVEWTFFRSDPMTGSGERRVAFAGKPVRETFEDGVLVERRVPSSDDPGAPPLVIEYRGPLGPAGIHEHVRLSNERFGYALVIHNHQIEELSCASENQEPDPR